MALSLPDELVHLEANCGLYALWMVLQHQGIQANIQELIKLSKYDQDEGTYTIALAIALKKMGFGVSFYTDKDPNISKKERACYEEAKQLNIPVKGVLSYQGILQATQNNKFVIVYYDTIEGIGQQSLIHSIDKNRIDFFDNFGSMTASVFERQRKAEGICQQTIVIDDSEFNPIATQRS